MQVSELAELTGTTVRTIRYYHQIGLLPVPASRYGHRDYDLVHVARLSRIRWLAQAGVPLERVGGMLASPAGPSTVVADLRHTLAALDGELARLTAQRERTSRLVAAAEAGEHLTPMPPATAWFYSELERRAPDDRVRRAVRQERDFMELAWYRGDLPPEANLIYERLMGDEAGLAESLRAFTRLAARSASPSAPRTAATDDGAAADDGVEEEVALVMERLRRQLGPDFAHLARTIDPELTRRAGELYLRVVDPADRPVGRALIDALVAAMEQARA